MISRHRIFMKKDIRSRRQNITPAGGRPFGSKPFRTLKAMLTILLITALGAGAAGVIIYAGLKAAAR